MDAPRVRWSRSVVTESLLLVWRRLQGGVGWLIQFISTRRNSGVVHPSAPSPCNAPGGVNPSTTPRSNAPGGGGDGRVRWRAGWNAFPALHRAPADAAPGEPEPPVSAPPSPVQEQPQPPQPQAPHHQFQMVDEELVSDEELAMYADYCRARSTSGKKVVCHLCIFVDGLAKTFKPSDMLIHCMTRHKTPGLECRVGGCMVRVVTQRELRRHKHFCHEIPTGWWQH